MMSLDSLSKTLLKCSSLPCGKTTLQGIYNAVDLIRHKLSTESGGLKRKENLLLELECWFCHLISFRRDGSRSRRTVESPHKRFKSRARVVWVRIGRSGKRFFQVKISWFVSFFLITNRHRNRSKNGPKDHNQAQISLSVIAVANC